MTERKPGAFGRRGVLRGVAGVSLLAAAPGWAARLPPRTLDPVLADLHRRTFDYFWQTSDATTGLVPDNWPDPNFCSIAAVGFALTTWCIGAESGYVSRADAARRTLTTLRTFWNGPQGPAPKGMMGHKGFFYHFLHMNSGQRYKGVELSSIDTCLFLFGALTAAGYFDRADPTEAEIRRLGILLYERVDWTFMARPNGLVSMGWHPEPNLGSTTPGGLLDRSWDRYNEGMMVYLLGLASPTHPLPRQAWESWSATIGGTWGANFGEPHLGFAPLFGHQYSHAWYDFRGLADAYMRGRGIDYFENSRRATLAQRSYAIANPGGFKDYSADVWGLTACQGPADVTATVDGREVRFHEYAARGPQSGDHEGVDDGTIAPTAAIGSLVFAPEVCVPLVHALRRKYRADLYDRYGFKDAFNPSFPADLPSKTGRHTASAGWVANGYLGIDQGPILIALENWRSGLVWNAFCRSATTGPIVRRGLAAAGFQAVGGQGAWLALSGRGKT